MNTSSRRNPATSAPTRRTILAETTVDGWTIVFPVGARGHGRGITAKQTRILASNYEDAVAERCMILMSRAATTADAVPPTTAQIAQAIASGATPVTLSPDPRAKYL